MTDPLGKRSSEPSTFAFSADGDLVGKDLQWSGWGSRARRLGHLLERKSGSIKTVSFPGSVDVSGPGVPRRPLLHVRQGDRARERAVPADRDQLVTPCAELRWPLTLERPVESMQPTTLSTSGPFLT